MILTCSWTDTGRRDRNEDACGAWQIRTPDGPVFLLAVADGLGGLPAGDAASRIAIDSLRRLVTGRCSGDPGTGSHRLDKILDAGVLSANRDVINCGAAKGEWYGMGTTLVAALIDEKGAGWLANVGDSRAYMLSGNRIRLITRDHSKIRELIDAGKITPEDAAQHPLSNIVTRILGSEGTRPDLFPLDLAAGWLLLCSDGLSGSLTEEEIGNLLSTVPIGAVCRELVSVSLPRSHYNVSAVVAGRIDR